MLAAGTVASSYAGPLGAHVVRQRHDIRAMLRRPQVQAKLRINEPNDPQEREADAVADQVLSTSPDTAANVNVCGTDVRAVHRQAESVEEEEEQVQAKERDGHPGKSAGAAVDSGLGSGRRLPGELRSFFEPRFGRSFDDVRIHTDAPANVVSDGLNARAFTYGRNIAFAAGEYRPETTEGRRLLAHELTHTIQQAGDARSIQRKVDPSQVRCEGLSKKRQKIVGDDPVTDISNANERAIKHLTLVISALQGAQDRIAGGAPIAWPTVSDVVAVGLAKRFGLNFKDEEVWIGTGDKTVSTLIRRFSLVRAALSTDMITYFCLAPTKAQDPDHSDHHCGGEWAFVIAGEFDMFLCKPWWKASLDDRATTLMHEAIHMVDKDVSDGGRKLLNAHCYDHYLADVNGLTIPKPFKGSC
jgi:hypothetical protein